jgi:hypothetical protein
MVMSAISTAGSPAHVTRAGDPTTGNSVAAPATSSTVGCIIPALHDVAMNAVLESLFTPTRVPSHPDEKAGVLDDRALDAGLDFLLGVAGPAFADPATVQRLEEEIVPPTRFPLLREEVGV